ncbi:hypothetical protein KEM55_001929 [Ascosphaera atra]|nr:hypothetical protein KEM55_001929 [Ascosphaera atra]
MLAASAGFDSQQGDWDTMDPAIKEFASGYPPKYTRVCNWHNTELVVQTLNSELRNKNTRYVIVVKVPKDEFDGWLQYGGPGSLIEWSSEEGFLVFAVASPKDYEMALNTMYEILSRRCNELQKKDYFRVRKQQRYEITSGRGKLLNQAWYLHWMDKPARLRAQRAAPVLVVMVGDSDEEDRLKRDAGIWINKFKEEGVIVLTICHVKHTIDAVKLVRWKAADEGYDKPPVIAAEMNVKKNADGKPSLVEDNEELTIPFKDIFLRSPDNERGERDIKISEDDLVFLANRLGCNEENERLVVKISEKVAKE